MHSEGRFGYIPRTSSPYEILGLSCRDDLTDEEVASAYRRAALKAHPDKRNGSQEKFEQVKAASEMIKTSELRDAFNHYGARQGPGPGDMMGNLVDKFLPLVFGALGGLVLTGYSIVLDIMAMSSSSGNSGSASTSGMSWLTVVAMCIISVGSGTAVSYKAPFWEVFKTGTIGLFVGGVIGFFFRIVLWLWKILLR